MPPRSSLTSSVPPPTPNKFKAIQDWLTGSWGGTIVIITSSIGSIFMLGFYIGSFVTRTELNNTIMTMRLDEQKELQDARDKGKDAALQELKTQNDQYEQLYQKLRKDLNK